MFPKSAGAVVTFSLLGESFDFLKHLGAVLREFPVMIYPDEIELDWIVDEPVGVLANLAFLRLTCQEPADSRVA